ncbi:hypothetical protein ACFQOZ_13830 [Comamonas endophytica]|uniref:hypothetical protein n=1 Tax=Comamonas endophytica TaxID=2949090 RepID=UPI00361384B2
MKRRTLLQHAGFAALGLALPAWAQTPNATRILVGALRAAAPTSWGARWRWRWASSSRAA